MGLVSTYGQSDGSGKVNQVCKSRRISTIWFHMLGVISIFTSNAVKIKQRTKGTELDAKVFYTQKMWFLLTLLAITN